MKTKGLTLLEILISVIILALVMFGVANLFAAGKRYVAISKAKMAGGEIGKLFLDPLQMAVRQDTWGQAENQLYSGNHTIPSQQIGTNQYSATYDVSAPYTNVNKVKININWTE